MNSDSIPAVSAATAGELSRSLRSRHVLMITIGGIIGAGLFVGSSAAIATVGPAAILSYALAGFVVLLVMRMLSEMAAATPGLGSFTEYTRLGLGNWAGFVSGWLYWYFWVVVVAALLVGLVKGVMVGIGYSAASTAAIYLLMLLVLLFRPRGLFGERIMRFE